MSHNHQSVFSRVFSAKLDAASIPKVKQEFKKGQTISLDGGAFRNEIETYYELPTIKRAKAILEAKNLGHEYTPVIGIDSFNEGAARLCFGAASPQILNEQVSTCQTVSSTSALHIAAVFLSRFFKESDACVYIGLPTWVNHEPLLLHAGLEVKTYRYYNREKKEVDFPNVLETIRLAPQRSIFVLQTCCHNPAGKDFSREQWTQLAQEMQEKQHFPVFDLAYQGFASGDLEEDVWPIRHFASRDMELMACVSFSKSMGLYSERVGALHIVSASAAVAKLITNHLRCIIRWEFSSAPAYGARLADLLLNDQELNQSWRSDVKEMASKIIRCRNELHDRLVMVLKTPGNWDHIRAERGFFSMLNLSEEQIRCLKEDFGIILCPNGRINVAGLNDSVLDKVAFAIDKVVRTSR